MIEGMIGRKVGMTQIFLEDAFQPGPQSCLRHLEIDQVAGPHAEQVPVKAEALLEIIHTDDDVAEAETAGLEAADRARRHEGLTRVD